MRNRIAWTHILQQRRRPRDRFNLRDFAEEPGLVPGFVRQCPVAMRTLDLVGPLDWACFEERDLDLGWHMRPVPYAAFAAGCLVKLDQRLASMGALRQYLVDHPALVWLLGFPLISSSRYAWGFDADASLPTQRHLTRMLRTLPNSRLQCLLTSTVTLLQTELAEVDIRLGETIALDTKHILAWVKENNPKAYIADRYDKEKQPQGDPDCRLGCKRRHNQLALAQEAPPTPSAEPRPAHKVSVGEFYWGYASGVVAAKADGWGEFVLAELTQPFDKSDPSYFFPLMKQVEQRLGFQPRFGALDAAFDAWYVYDYFHRQDDPDAFAAVPFSEKGGYKVTDRQFSPDGLPLCAAGKPMPLKLTYIDRTVTLIEHERGKYVCPLRHPEATGEICPINHENWAKEGCTVTMPTSIGARLRYQLDRDSEAYKQVYRQRTADERINSQAVALGIERPKLRNGAAIANLNTLIYVLINLRALQRIRQLKAERLAGTA